MKPAVEEPSPDTASPKDLGESAEHLRLLSIFHYLVAGLMALFAFFPVLHLAIGISLIIGKPFFTKTSEDAPKNAPPVADLFGWFFTCFSATWILFGLAMAVAMVFAGRYIKQRRSRMFCMVVAALSCFFMPFGTVLGVFTIIVLNRPEVHANFDGPSTGTYPLNPEETQISQGCQPGGRGRIYRCVRKCLGVHAWAGAPSSWWTSPTTSARHVRPWRRYANSRARSGACRGPRSSTSGSKRASTTLMDL